MIETILYKMTLNTNNQINATKNIYTYVDLMIHFYVFNSIQMIKII